MIYDDSIRYQYRIHTTEYDESVVLAKPIFRKPPLEEIEFGNGPHSIQYTILQFARQTGDASPEAVAAAGIYRSVLLSASGRPLAFAPVHALPFEQFTEKHPVVHGDIQITQTIEGTMILLFYNPEESIWEIATKSAVGGNYWFYRTQYFDETPKTESPKQKTFREMFLEALSPGNGPISSLDEIPFVQALSKELSYCFVLQHPENPIVQRHDQPSVWLVALFKIEPCIPTDESRSHYRIANLPQSSFSSYVPALKTMPGIVRLPAIYHFPDETALSDLVSETVDFPASTEMGWMITHFGTGERTSFEYPEYTRLRELRGNHPNLQYQYLVLLRLGKIAEFLSQFPEYRSLFTRFYLQYHDFITQIHTAYVKHYILKDPTPIPKKYFVHICRIHKTIYLPSLATEKIIIRHHIVRQYVDALEPREILYSLHTAM